MNKVKSLLFFITAALLLLAGCGETRRYETVERGPQQICVPDMGKAEAMQTAEDVLARMHFTIDKADAKRGLIRTRPLPGAQFFEFWRSDSAGAFNSVEANLHCIRRVVELDVNQQGERKPQQLCIDCEVTVQRLSLPEHHVSSSARAYEMFSRSTAAMQNLELNPDQEKEMAWLDMGKDTKLAAEILKRIEKKVKSQK